MQIPTFWARASGEAEDPKSRRLSLIAWGWSATDQTEAVAGAKARLARMVERITRGEGLPDKYTYGDRPIREERLDELKGPDGAPILVVTRNRYGSLVLNSARAMFIDVDAPAPVRGSSLFSGLFRKRAVPQEDPALTRIRSALAALSPASFRIYRTAAGFRILALDREYDPTGPDTLQIMDAVGADPNYVQLCRAQSSFRARLTPKPWRAGYHPTPPGVFPRTEPDLEARYQQWIVTYDAACRGYATCALVEQVGSGPVAESVKPVLVLHDRLTQVGSELKLA